MPSSDRLVPSLGRSQGFFKFSLTFFFCSFSENSVFSIIGMSEEFSGWKSDDSIVKRVYYFFLKEREREKSLVIKGNNKIGVLNKKRSQEKKLENSVVCFVVKSRFIF